MKDKVYFIYASIPEEDFNRILKYLVKNNHIYRWKKGVMYGLYAWTGSKKLLKKFFEFRERSIYTVVEKDVCNEDEYETIKYSYDDMKLGKYKYAYNYYDATEQIKTEYMEIVGPKNEYYNVNKVGEENMYEFGPKLLCDYNIFNKEIIKALDALGYTSEYDFTCGDDDRMSFADNQKSYGLTVLGNPYPYNIDDEVGKLLYLYKFMFYGKSDKSKTEDEE